MKSLPETQSEKIGWGDRMSDLRERTAEFLGDALEAVIMGPAEKVLDWTEDKPAIVQALGAYVVAPALIIAESAGGTLAVMATAAAVGPIAATGVGLAAGYVWFQTFLAGGGMHDQVMG